MKQLVKDSVQSVQAGTQLTNESGQALEKISGAVQGVSDVNAEMAVASREQSSGLAQINSALMQMDEMTQQSAALVEEAAAVSEAMDEQADELEELVSYFKLSKEREHFEENAYKEKREKESRNSLSDVQAVTAHSGTANVRSSGSDEWKEF